MPSTLPAEPKVLWRTPLAGQGLAGVAATSKVVIVADREGDDSIDVFRCLDAETGIERWALRYLAPGNLDYGNSPRATPLIQGDVVYLYGAFGHLHCVDLNTGDVRWQMDVRTQFGADDRLVWGTCSSPLLVDGKLIVNPGATLAPLVALDPRNGSVLWSGRADRSAFSSFIVAELGGRRQIVGYDATSLGGWDVKTGDRIWKLIPPVRKDFNVPTPIAYDGKLFVTTENNGARLYRFSESGQIDPTPIAENNDLAPDTHTPVVVGDRLFGVWHDLYCLDLKNGLKPLWVGADPAFDGYASIVASEDRLLVTSLEGELLLVDAKGAKPTIISRLRLFENDPGVYSHPALVGRRIYVRSSDAVMCVALE